MEAGRRHLFRHVPLADSIPVEVIASWEADNRQWLALHGITDSLPENEWHRRYEQIPEGVRRAYEREQERRHLVELDKCHGSCLLRVKEASDALASAMRFHHEKRLLCGDFVIMPNHAHWIVVPFAEWRLEDLLGSIKRYSAVRINKLAAKTGTLWQEECFDHIIRNADQLERIRQYIKANPGNATRQHGNYYYFRAKWLNVGRE